MTREEFMETIEDWSELICFCNENYLSTCQDIYDVEDVANYVSDILSEHSSYDAMCNIPYLLECFDADDDYFVLCNGQFTEADDFEEYKIRTANEYEENHDWDEEEEDYYEDELDNDYYEDDDESDWYEYESEKQVLT